jgi:hypothetical protein
MEIQLHAFLTSALDGGGEWSDSRPGRFTPGERIPYTHWIGGWVDTRARLEEMAMRNILTSCRESKSSHPVCSLVAELSA